MKTYRLTEPAADDLADIREWFLDQDAVEAGKKLGRTIIQKCEMLGRQPGMGREREDLKPGLRSFHVDKYLIFFRRVEDDTEVLRILHGRRNVTPDLFRD